MLIKSFYNNKCPHPVYKKKVKYNRSDNFKKKKDDSLKVKGYGCTICDVPPPWCPSFDAGRKCRCVTCDIKDDYEPKSILFYDEINRSSSKSS